MFTSFLLTIIDFKIGCSSIFFITVSGDNTYIVPDVVRYIQLKSCPLMISEIKINWWYNINTVSGGFVSTVTSRGPS